MPRQAGEAEGGRTVLAVDEHLGGEVVGRELQVAHLEGEDEVGAVGMEG